MVTFRVRHQKRYTTIDNNSIRDKSISLKARGLHHILLSYPDDWEINEKHLVKEASDLDGRDAIRGALKELVRAGYIRKVQTRTQGRFGRVDYDIYETPFPSDTETVDGKPVDGKTVDGKPVDGKTVDGKPVDGKTVDGKPDDILNTYSTKDLKERKTNTHKATQSADAQEFCAGAEEKPEPEQQDIPPPSQLKKTTLASTEVSAEDKRSAPDCSTNTTPVVQGAPDPRHPASRFEARMQATAGTGPEAEHNRQCNRFWPQLVEQGLAYVWAGPKRGDFAPELIEGVRIQLRKLDKPHERSDILTFIQNRITAQEWLRLEDLYERGKGKLAKAAATRTAPAPTPTQPPAPAQSPYPQLGQAYVIPDNPGWFQKENSPSAEIA